MVNKTTKISARITDVSVDLIRENLDAFGCKTVTQFVQQAVEEKLQRYSIGQLIEASISKQNVLNSKLESVLKGVLIHEKNNADVVAQIATSLKKISAGFDAFTNQK